MRNKYLNPNFVGKVLLAIVILSLPFIIESCQTTEELVLEPSASEQAIFVEPEAGAGPVLDQIQQAQESIDLEIYLLSHRKIIRALKEAHKRGVAVRVILEQEPYGQGPSNQNIFSELSGAGIAVRWGNPHFVFTHTKAMVVDNETAVISTANFTYAGFSSNRDFVFIDRNSEDVQTISDIFQSDWERKNIWPKNPNIVVSPSNSRWKLESLIKQAQKNIFLSVEVLDDDQIKELLIKARERRVDVKIILAEADKVDVNKSSKEYLARHGVEVRHLKKPFMHAKTMIIDDKTLYVGSVNFSRNSLDENREIGILTLSPELIGQVKTVFNSDWQKAGVVVQ